MTDKVLKYARELRKAGVTPDQVDKCAAVYANDEVAATLESPVVVSGEKHEVIEKLFPVECEKFIKDLCDDHNTALLPEIAEGYREYTVMMDNVVEAKLVYVTEPDERQLAGIKDFLKRKFGTEKIELEMEKDPSLMGGFTLTAAGIEYDWSLKGRMTAMANEMTTGRKAPTGADASQIISILKEEITNYEFNVANREVGHVTWVGDGIATIHGIDQAMYGEIVIFENGVKGMVQDIRRDSIGVILFDRDAGIGEGSKVSRTGKMAGIPVGDAYLGRIIDALGAPIDGEGEIVTDQYRPVENEAPGIVDRKAVGVPMETGILSIDSMFPIGRGQRELIIGDRQTGKTSIATDTIINQRGKDVVCIYVAIGQKASTIAKVVSLLKKNDAMDYTVIVAATASDPAPLQYIAPYAGTAMAEYFMYQGKDVLIIYDDLSKHAVAYRALSLLLERSPGREAYPGDVFYLHSRLLERSSRLNEENGGGSITALPIIETQAGDVSAYIPTNVISITDGQIFLESGLFFSGMRPAVNVGLSVSRVGGAAQTKAMKKAAGSIRIDLAQYREMEVFTQFSSDLDEDTKNQLKYGKGLMELLKQPLCNPLSMAEQVIILWTATHKCFMDVDVKKIKDYKYGMLKFVSSTHPEIIKELNETKQLSDELGEKILQAAAEYAESLN